MRKQKKTPRLSPAPPGPAKGPGIQSRALAERLRKVETSNITWLGDEFPVFWERGEGLYVYDVDGQDYLDMTAAFGVTALGHVPKSSQKAISDQSQRLIHGMGDVHPPAIKVELLERLAEIAPVDNPRITLGTGGSMATEIALKSVRLSTGKPGVLAFEGAYHGLTLGALGVVGHERFLSPFAGLAPPGFPRLPFPEINAEDCDPALVKALSDEVFEHAERIIETHKDEIGGIIIEPIQGRGGIRVAVPGFLTKLHAFCQHHNLLLICDEIFTGFYRTGPRFACDLENVRPDILLLGKALGGGMPIGACIGRQEIMDSFGPSTGEAIHTETFLGHPVVMATALSTLQTLESADRSGQIKDRGQELRRILWATLGQFPERFQPVHGRGLMLGIACCHKGKPDPALCKSMVGAALKSGIILLGGGIHGHVLQFTPAISIGSDEIVEVGKRLSETLARVFGRI